MKQAVVIDVGTTGVKTALMDRAGRILKQGYRGYPIRTLNDRVEQNPADWWAATVAALSSVVGDAEDVVAVVLSGQMQDLIPLQRDGSSAPAILYSDLRAREEALQVERLIGRDRLVRTTGNIQDASSLLAKLVWFREHEPERYAGTDCVLLGAHDYIAWKLTGRKFSDFTTLSTTGLLDIGRNEYDCQIVDALGIRRDLLPPAVGASHLDGVVTDEAAGAVGLPAGTPVYHGSGDVGSTTIGAGAGMPGSVSCYLGTSGWLALTSQGGLADPATGIYNLRHPETTEMIRVGPMLMSAGNADWAVDAFGYSAGDGRFARFNDEVVAARPGQAIYLPYLVGERAPFRDPAARGAFVGIGRSTTRGELSRAVLEGVAFAMRSICEAGGEKRNGSGRFTLSGGGARSPVWPQIMADVFEREVVVPQNADMAGIYGAFTILAKELGWVATYAPPDEVWNGSVSFRPHEENCRIYDGLYSVFLELYPVLKESYSRLAGLRT